MENLAKLWQITRGYTILNLISLEPADGMLEKLVEAGNDWEFLLGSDLPNLCSACWERKLKFHVVHYFSIPDPYKFIFWVSSGCQSFVS